MKRLSWYFHLEQAELTNDQVIRPFVFCRLSTVSGAYHLYANVLSFEKQLNANGFLSSLS